MSNYEELLEGQEADAKELAAISALAEVQLQREAVVDDLMERLKVAKAELRQVKETDLPDAMAAVSMASFTLTSGAKITIKDNFYASIPAARKPMCADWLCDNGQSALVKQDFHIPFDATDEDEIEEFEDRLKDLGIGYSLDFKMNTMSVKAALKQLILEGEEVPMDLFGLRRVSEAKIDI